MRERAGLRANVTNFGEGGYVSTQEVVALLIELRNHNVPDIVILYDGINGVFSALQTGQAGIPQNEFNREIEFNILNNPQKRSLLYAGSVMTFFRSLNTYRVVSSVYRRLQKEGEQGESIHIPETGADEVVRTYTSNVRIIESLAHHFDFKVLFYWQPLLFTKNEFSVSERELEENSAAYKAFYLKVYEKQRSVPYLREKNNFHDISLMFINDPEPYFIDFIHVNEKANTKIAERMFNDVFPIMASVTK